MKKLVSDAQKIGSASEKWVSVPENKVCMLEKMVSRTPTTVSGFQKMVSKVGTIFPTTGTRVTAPQKMVSVAETMV